MRKLLAILALFLVSVGLVSTFAAAPAYAQGQQQPPPPGGGGGNGNGGDDTSWVRDMFQPSPDSAPAVQKANEFRAYFESGNNCWACRIFDGFAAVVFERGRAVAEQAKTPLSQLIVSISTLFALWTLGSAFISGDASDLLGRWKTFWKVCLGVTAGTAVLQANAFTFMWDFVFGPLMSIPLAVSQAVGGDALAQIGGSCSAGPTPAGTPDGARDVIPTMRQAVCGGHQISVQGMGLGWALATTIDWFWGTLVNFVTGCLLVIVFLWIAISFPLRFIDVLLRLTVVGVISPILVVCAVYKPTRSYVVTALSNVLYAGCLFAFTSIMFVIGGEVFMDIFNEHMAGMGERGAMETVIAAIIMLGGGVVFASMLKMAPALASEFSAFRGSSGGVGDAASGFAGAALSLPAKAVGVGAGGMIAARTMGRGMAGGMASKLGKGVTKEGV